MNQDVERASAYPVNLMFDEPTGEKCARSVKQEGSGDDGDMELLTDYINK